mgnify:CR=1 FL=1
MLNVSAMLIDMLVLFISIIFILLEKISSDYEALEWKYLFYYRTGMPEKKRRKNIYKEINHDIQSCPDNRNVYSGSNDIGENII